MFILSFPDKKIRKVLADKSNFEGLKKSIDIIKKPFVNYHGEDFVVHSVVNEYNEQAVNSFERMKDLNDALVIVDFSTKTTGKIGCLILYIYDSAELFCIDGVPFEGKKPYEPFKGTWEEVLSEYINFLNL